MWTNYNYYNPNPHSASSMSSLNFRHQKRRMDLTDLQPPKPSKIRVTEEVMASQLDGIHLSNTYTSHGTHETPDSAVPSTSGVNFSSSGNLSDAILHPSAKLTICDELKGLKDSLSLSLLPKLMEPEKPTRALILWQPPTGDLGKFWTPVDKNDNNDTEQKRVKPADPELSKDSPSTSSASSSTMDVAPPLPTPAANSSTMDVELENNNTEMICAYSATRAI
ncbi:Hypothetical protein NTJ_14216 [Nesidiocoris tenuis]|uniref:Uncharacterized protein n=1 Tax=Nesidiocoris tenuis TaxID=355587 RepID=A0ABN7BCJ2_9HEMI|nr:Hypothetical protein NTJ_14216 [Nesidiocoris tenuis]